MNERIKELMTQAGFDPAAIERMGVMPQAEKFAELIIKECADIARQRMFADYEGNAHKVAHNNAIWCALIDIEDHFGIDI